MAEALKNVYSKVFIEDLAKHLKALIPEINPQKFVADVFSSDWNDYELKARMYHISKVMHTYLPSNFEKAAELLAKLIERLKKGDEEMSFEFMFLPDYVEKYGLEDYDSSMWAMEKITQFTSCEFAIRPFILKYPERTLKQMLRWSRNSNAMVRRLASEGSRPRLPWAMGIPFLKKDPAPILPILDNLKHDPSEIVRRSVANNLNDISKDHPELVLQLAKEWKNHSMETAHLVKYGCRTLLKQGNPQALALFGLAPSKKLRIKNLNIKTPIINLGENLDFEFELENRLKSEAVIRLEYAIYFRKANDTLAKKVFKISEKKYGGNASFLIKRSQPFKPITTRRYYAGKHKLSIIVNGLESSKKSFELEINP